MKTRTYRLGIVFSWLIASAVLLPGSALGLLVSSDALFLAPSSLQEDTYDSSLGNFHLLEGLDGSSGLTQTYFGSDVVAGGTITGIQILPLLMPNPSSASGQGEYTDADLVAITLSNYASFFLALPNFDYYADLASDGSQASIEYYAAGSYFVKVTAESNGVTYTKVFEDNVDDFQGAVGGAPRDPTKPGRVIASPNADLNLVSNRAFEPFGSNGYSPAAFRTLQDEGKNPLLVNNFNDVVAKIQAACKAKGGPISVALVGHGAPGLVQIGSTYITNNPVGPNQISPGDFQKLIDRIDQDPNKPKCVSAIDFYSCNVAVNTPGRTQGSDFLKAMQDSIPDTRAFNQFTTAMAPYQVFNARRQVVTIRRGFFDVGAGGILGSIGAVPEPATLILVTSACALLVVLRRVPTGRAHKRPG